MQVKIIEVKGEASQIISLSSAIAVNRTKKLSKFGEDSGKIDLLFKTFEKKITPNSLKAILTHSRGDSQIILFGEYCSHSLIKKNKNYTIFIRYQESAGMGGGIASFLQLHVCRPGKKEEIYALIDDIWSFSGFRFYLNDEHCLFGKEDEELVKIVKDIKSSIPQFKQANSGQADESFEEFMADIYRRMAEGPSRINPFDDYYKSNFQLVDWDQETL